MVPKDPINIRRHLQLNEYGMDPSQIVFGEVTMESEKYIACNSKACGSSEVLVIDLETVNQPLQLSISVESAIMHPRQNIVGLKCGKTLRIIDMSSNFIVKEHTGEDVIMFWRWIDEATIGFITHNGSVFHWTLAGATIPTRMFMIDRKLRDNFRVSDYRGDADHKFFAVVGQAKNSRASPIIQLFDTASGTSLLFEGHTLRFAQLTLGNNCLPSNLLVYSSATSSPWKHILKIIDTSCHVDDSIQFCNKPAVNAAFSTKDTDSPASIHISPKQGIVYLATTVGFVHIFDLDSGLELYSCTVSNDRIYVTTDLSDGGFMLINGRGSVCSVSMNEEAVIDHVAQWNKVLARKLAQRWNLRPSHTSHRATIPIPAPPSESEQLSIRHLDHWRLAADKLEREREELAARNRELERKYRRALMMMGRADQTTIEQGQRS